jgi:branched-chain amino acid transport system substrate-binding protein
MGMTITRIGRRTLLKTAGATAATAAIGFTPTRFAIGQQAKIKLGLMLPYSGTFALLGQNITDALKMAIEEKGGKLGGREVTFVQVDDESAPPKADQNANRLVVGEKVDFLIGTVHSGVAMAMAKVAREEETMMICPNAGADAITRGACAPNIFRTSFSNWQPSYPMGKVMYDKGHRNVITMAWKYAAGEESMGGFKEGFTAAGGKIAKEIWVPFPDAEFQANLTDIANTKPDAVFVFFAGGGAAKFVKDYHAAGLRNSIPLYGSGFLTDGVLKAQGEAAQGLLTTLHYADGLDNAVDKKFRPAFQKATNRPADVYAVQGYDTGLLLAAALDAVKGDVKAKKQMIATMEAAEIDSPRGKWKMSKSHNPVQDIYLREAKGEENRYVSVAHKALSDPGTGCKMA